MWNQIEHCLKAVKFSIRLELRPSDHNLHEYDYVQAEKSHYFPTVVNMASLAFESVFNPDESMFLLYRRWGSKRTKIRATAYLFRQLKVEQDLAIATRKRKTQERGYWIREALVESQRQHCDYQRIFQAIAHKDFNLQPMIRGQVLFISLKTGLVYWMYDDRGVLIAAPSQEILPKLPDSLNILRYEDVHTSDFLI